MTTWSLTALTASCAPIVGPAAELGAVLAGEVAGAEGDAGADQAADAGGGDADRGAAGGDRGAGAVRGRDAAGGLGEALGGAVLVDVVVEAERGAGDAEALADLAQAAEDLAPALGLTGPPEAVFGSSGRALDVLASPW